MVKGDGVLRMGMEKEEGGVLEGEVGRGVFEGE